jgi:calcineurin-like phosphoesterase
MMQLLKNKVSAICGTHTHIGTDDLEITEGTFYVTDVGLTGCRDNVIGMDSKMPIQKALTGLGGHFDVPNNCKSIMQIVIMDIDKDGKTVDAFKIKLYDDQKEILSKAILN